jgi:hypothetical protein
MAATRSVVSPPAGPGAAVDYAYLLLGDLRLLLEDQPDHLTSRWLLAVLDALLTLRVPLDDLQLILGDTATTWTGTGTIRSTLYAKLQRLRDRIAHGKPYAILGNEVRCDLTELLD